PLIRAALDTPVINARRPFPAYANLFYLANVGTSDYNALQATLSRTSGRFTYLAAYTLSRSKGTVPGDFGTLDPLDPANRHSGYLPSHRRHQATFSWAWRLGDPASGGAAAVLL